MRRACVRAAARRWPKASSFWRWIRRSTRSTRHSIRDGLAKVFASVALVVRDWKPMLARLAETIAQLKKHPPPIQDADLAENLAFLGWLADNHFTFLGCRDYVFRDEGEGKLEARYESGLGVLAEPKRRVIRRGRRPFEPDARAARVSHAAGADHHHQIEHALHRPSARAYGLYRRQEFRRERQARRRAPLRRTLHLGRLRPIAGRDPAAAPQGGARARRIGAAAVGS